MRRVRRWLRSIQAHLRGTRCRVLRQVRWVYFPGCLLPYSTLKYADEFQSDRPLGPAEFSGHPTMETGVAWDEFTTIPDPQMLATMTAANKGQMMNLTPNVWNPGNVPSGLPPNSPMSGASPMSSHAQPMNSAPTYAMQPDGTVWQVPPQPTRAMSFPGQPDMNSSYPTQYQQQMPPDLKRRMTTPTQPISAPTPGSQSSPGSSTDMQPPPGPVPFQAPPGMGYTHWPSMNPMASMGVVPYPMYAGDPSQQPPFANPPMGHPHSGP